MKQGPIDGTRINITPAGNRKTADRSSSASRRNGVKTEESLEIWEHRTLSSIFRLTLDADTIVDAQGHSLHLVSSVRNDLEEQNEPLRLSTAILDQAILEAASNLGKTTPLDYLLACWKRVSRNIKSFKVGKATDPKFVVVKEARRLCMSYCIFAITMPEMFG